VLEDLAIVRCWRWSLCGARSTGPAAAAAKNQCASAGIAVAGLAALLAAGRWLLDPFFASFARAGRRGATAAALAGRARSAVFMQSVGLSMAMGAFLRGRAAVGIQFPGISSRRTSSRFAASAGLSSSASMSLNLRIVADEWMMVLAASRVHGGEDARCRRILLVIGRNSPIASTTAAWRCLCKGGGVIDRV